jgi:hypothetical protein
MNMVRAGACSHPSEWLGGAFREICGERERYRMGSVPFPQKYKQYKLLHVLLSCIMTLYLFYVIENTI